MTKSLGEKKSSTAAVQKVFVRMNDDRCEVSVDSSGELLHRRGYRQARVAAPLRETLAAGCLLACDYDGTLPLLDMMTGSGTFAIEAALIALHRAPGKGRDFAFMDWPKYRPGLWQQLLIEAQREEKSTLPSPIFAVDNNPKAIEAAQINLEAIGLGGSIQLSCGNMQQLQPQYPSGFLICNPPYGERLGKNASLKALYHDLGQLYGSVFTDWQGAIICPESELLKVTGLSFSPLLRFANGGIKVSLLKKS
jgi:putative N6-adenine-specific DNA methylase